MGGDAVSVLQEYKRSLKSIEVEEFFDLVFYRPLAFVFVKLIYTTNITPNQLTFFSMCLGIAGGVSYAFGFPRAYIAGGLFYMLYNIIDCSDGQLARLKHNGTPIGRILDGVADYVASFAAYIGIGIGFAGTSEHPVAFWCLTAAAGFSNALQSGLLDFYRNRYLDITLGRKSILVDEQKMFETEYASMKGKSGHLLDKALIWIYLKYSTVQRRFTEDNTPAAVTSTVDATAYVSHNRGLMRWWTFLGPTTQWTLLIVCSFLNRLDVYLWVIVGLGNVLAMILTVIQRNKDRILHLRGTR